MSLITGVIFRAPHINRSGCSLCGWLTTRRCACTTPASTRSASKRSTSPATCATADVIDACSVQALLYYPHNPRRSQSAHEKPKDRLPLPTLQVQLHVYSGSVGLCRLRSSSWRVVCPFPTLFRARPRRRRLGCGFGLLSSGFVSPDGADRLLVAESVGDRLAGHVGVIPPFAVTR